MGLIKGEISSTQSVRYYDFCRWYYWQNDYIDERV